MFNIFVCIFSSTVVDNVTETIEYVRLPPVYRLPVFRHCLRTSWQIQKIHHLRYED